MTSPVSVVAETVVTNSALVEVKSTAQGTVTVQAPSATSVVAMNMVTHTASGEGKAKLTSSALSEAPPKPPCARQARPRPKCRAPGVGGGDGGPWSLASGVLESETY